MRKTIFAALLAAFCAFAPAAAFAAQDASAQGGMALTTEAAERVIEIPPASEADIAPEPEETAADNDKETEEEQSNE